jgi:hypothetical protein
MPGLYIRRTMGISRLPVRLGLGPSLYRRPFFGRLPYERGTTLKMPKILFSEPELQPRRILVQPSGSHPLLFQCLSCVLAILARAQHSLSFLRLLPDGPLYGCVLSISFRTETLARNLNPSSLTTALPTASGTQFAINYVFSPCPELNLAPARYRVPTMAISVQSGVVRTC